MNSTCTARALVRCKIDGEIRDVGSDCVRPPGHEGDHYNVRFYWREGEPGGDGRGIWVRDA